MTALLDRVDAFLDAFGEPILVDGVSTRAVARVLSPAEARVYLDTTLVDSAGRPVRGFFVKETVTAVVGDLVTWLDTAHEIVYIREYRVSGVAIGKSLLTFPD